MQIRKDLPLLMIPNGTSTIGENIGRNYEKLKIEVNIHAIGKIY
jgi:hypothetical protein